jgi:hypothetical protein
LTSTALYTLKVGCGSWTTMTEDTGFVTTKSVLAEATGASAIYTIAPPIMTPSFCTPNTYTLQTSNTNIEFVDTTSATCTYDGSVNPATCS